MLRRFSSSLASRYVMRSSQIPPRSLSLLPSPVQLAVSLTRALSAQASGGAKGEKPDDAGFNIFEQLKAQKKESGQSQFEEEPELNEKDKERLRWQQDKAEEALNARRFRLFRSGASITILGLGISYALLGLDFGSANEETDTSNSNFFERHHQRVKGALGGYYDYWTNPPTTKLLPDPLPAPYRRPLTLCVELNDSLVHLVWDKALGWRVAMRPGVKQFLSNLSRYYEIVIYTTQPGHLAEPVTMALDPYQYATYRLYRDHTRLVKGKYIKDVSQLNRDPKKVIMIDVNEDSYSLQPENGLHLKPWKGEAGDVELPRMETFLEELYLLVSMTGAEDIRPFLKVVHTLNREDPSAAWATHKHKLREEFDKLQEPAASMTPQKSQGFLSSWFGARAEAAKPKPRNLIDLLETVAKEERETFAKEQEQNRAHMVEMQKQHEDAIKKQMEENQAKKLKLVDYMMGAGQPEQATKP